MPMPEQKQARLPDSYTWILSLEVDAELVADQFDVANQVSGEDRGGELSELGRIVDRFRADQCKVRILRSPSREDIEREQEGERHAGEVTVALANVSSAVGERWTVSDSSYDELGTAEFEDRAEAGIEVLDRVHRFTYEGRTVHVDLTEDVTARFTQSDGTASELTEFPGPGKDVVREAREWEVAATAGNLTTRVDRHVPGWSMEEDFHQLYWWVRTFASWARGQGWSDDEIAVGLDERLPISPSTWDILSAAENPGER